MQRLANTTRKAPGMNLAKETDIQLAHVKFAAIYTRVSTEDQSKGFSMPSQIEVSPKLAGHEWHTVPEPYILIDEGLSGPTRERPGGERAKPS
jgi:Resolvase, N terminal domain